MNLPWKRKQQLVPGSPLGQERRKPEGALKRIEVDDKHRVETKQMLAVVKEQNAATSREIQKLQAIVRYKRTGA